MSKFAPDSNPIVTDTGKIIYTNADTGIEVVYDIDGDYYRIVDTNITTNRSALDTDGNAVSNNIMLENGKQRGMSKAEYQSTTHFNNTDTDFPYDK